MTNLVDRLERELYAAATARPRDSARYAAVLERAVRTCSADPEAAEVLDLADLYLELATEYEALGRREAALNWLTDGLRLALHTADPERLVNQLVDLRQQSLDGLGRPADALQEEATRFLREKQQARPTQVEEPAPEPANGAAPGPVSRVALAWLPAGDYEQAVTLWPELAESELVAGPAGPLPHRLYCRAMQQKLAELSRAGLPGLAIAPVRVAPFTAWRTEQGQQPDSEARATYAAHLAAHADSGVVSWPPDRNQPCWCGSERKYKKCCAAPSLVDPEPQR